MPNKCVVWGCSNVPNIPEGIALHSIPYFNDERPEAKKRRTRWIKFVKVKRAKWEPTRNSCICSVHFRVESFERRFTTLATLGKPAIPRLKRDSFGVNVYPTLHAGQLDSPKKQQTYRNRRKTLRESLKNATVSTAASKSVPSSTAHQDHHDDATVEDPGTTEPVSEPEPMLLPVAQREEVLEVAPVSNTEDITSAENREDENVDFMETEETSSTRDPTTGEAKWQKERRLLRNQVISLKSHLRKRKLECRRLTRRLKNNKTKNKATQTVGDSVPQEESVTDSEWDYDSDDQSEEEVTEEEPDDSYETQSEESANESEDDIENSAHRVQLNDTNLRSEPKFIVFLSQLLLLFKFCHCCKSDNPLVEVSQVGTEVVIKTACSNPKCLKRENVWHSQPVIPGWGVPAGNFLLCMAILLAGGSISKISKIFAHMGLGCVSMTTFFKHQRTKLFPAIHMYWKSYQKKMLDNIKSMGSGVVLAGDGRHDSMGHSAKYGAYTMFCCTVPMIIHFALIQRNQVGNSPAMEFEGFKQCMDYLIGYGIVILTFISDRHTGIACHMKKVLTNIVHYFDLWHLKKKIRKVLTKISKEKHYEEVKEWIKPCERHLYWSATSTSNGSGTVIWAKFKSFLSHIVNVHNSLDDPIFNKCNHGILQPRRWLSKGSEVYEKICKALTKDSLKKGIQQASPWAQTSCLEGFHSLINQFAPKMIAYSYVGMYCRHILAAMHFNLNLRREVETTGGNNRQKVVYPKFKNGEATIRDVRVKPDYGYVEEIFQTFMNSSKEDLTAAQDELRQMTPAPMNSMLEKQPREEALQKHLHRKSIVVEDVPPTCADVPEQNQLTSREHAKRAPHCSLCKNPMKGHKNVIDCPKNQRN